MCRMANSIPARAVIMVQRKAPALSPIWADCPPISMVKLLVRRMKVINATLATPWKGLGQLAWRFG